MNVWTLLLYGITTLVILLALYVAELMYIEAHRLTKGDPIMTPTSAKFSDLLYLTLTSAHREGDNVIRFRTETQPTPAADPEGWIAWDFSNPNGPDLLEGARVQVRFRGGQSSGYAQTVPDWDWADDALSGDILAYRVV